MTFLTRAVRGSGDDAVNQVLGSRGRLGGAAGSVTSEQMMRLSVAWACRTLRAELVSTMLINVFREIVVGGERINVAVPTPPVLLDPAGDETGVIEYLASSTMDLDGHGNAFSVIMERDQAGIPRVLRLASAATASVARRKGKLSYVLDGQEVDPAQVLHEKQNTVAGLSVGLSAIAYAALSASAGLSAAQFATDWFSNGATPKAHLKNTARRLDKVEARRTKANYEATVEAGSTFVSGSDWELKLVTGKASEALFLEQANATNLDLCRFFRVPADLVDVPAGGGASITYANITQRNLQFLIMNLNPVLRRREDMFTRRLLPDARFAEFDRSSLLRMDPATLATVLKTRIDSRTLTPDEARDVDNLPPLSEEQEAQFARLFGSKATPPVPGVPGFTPSP